MELTESPDKPRTKNPLMTISDFLFSLPCSREKVSRPDLLGRTYLGREQHSQGIRGGGGGPGIQQLACSWKKTGLQVLWSETKGDSEIGAVPAGPGLRSAANDGAGVGV